MRVALKVDVPSLRAVTEAAPRLLELFARYEVCATFLVSPGPDAGAGRFPWAFNNPERRRAALREGVRIEEAGHELGVFSFDSVRWQRWVTHRDQGWTRRQLERALQVFTDLFGRAPEVHGAAGWQINADTPRLEQTLGLRYASDTRGTTPFLPVTAAGTSQCPQIPTTLPVFEELIGRDGVDAGNVHEYIYMESQRLVSPGHVFTLRADRDGLQWLPVIEKLLIMWRGSQREMVSLKTLYETLDLVLLPRHQVGLVKMAGFKRPVAVQIPKVQASGLAKS